jgi:hypothetical protein
MAKRKLRSARAELPKRYRSKVATIVLARSRRTAQDEDNDCGSLAVRGVSKVIEAAVGFV